MTEWRVSNVERRLDDMGDGFSALIAENDDLRMRVEYLEGDSTA
jgi:hypothetical protein